MQKVSRQVLVMRPASTCLRREQSGTLCVGNELGFFHQTAMQRVGKGGGETRGEEVDIQLKISIGVVAEDSHLSTVPVAGAHQVERQAPGVFKVRRHQSACFSPVEFRGTRFQNMKVAGRCPNAGAEFECVKVVAVECRNQDPIDLMEALGDLEFFRGAPHRKVVYKDVPLFNRALCDTTEFTELQIPEMLHSEPDSCTQHRQ